MFSNLLNRFDRRIEILDDLDDHWYFLPFVQVARPTVTNHAQDSETSQEGKISQTVEIGELNKVRNEIVSLNHSKKSL